MAKQPDIKRLRRLVKFVSSKETTMGNDAPWEYSRRAWAEAQVTIDELVSSEGARYRQSGGGYSLRLAGVNTTCTSGPAGLLTNWKHAAERRISQAEGV